MLVTKLVKIAAFQFAGDVMGGYDNPYQQYEFLNYPGAQEAVDKLYNKYGMTLIGWWIPGHESLISVSYTHLTLPTICSV